MKITFLVPMLSQNGGIRVIAEYGRQLIALGHEVTFVSVYDKPAGLRRRIRMLLRREVRPSQDARFFLDMSDRLIDLPGSHAIDYAKFPDADFLIATWWETVEWAVKAPARCGRPVHLMQGYEMFPFLPAERVRRTYEEEIPKIAVSQWIADQVERHHGRASTAVILNSVDSQAFPMKAFVAHDPIRLGFVYSSFGGKNSALIPPLARALERRGIAAEFVAFHSEPITLPGFEGLLRESYLKPQQADIPAIYQSCDLWLWPSLEEGFGLPILEALSCGTPVVAGLAGAAPDVIRTGVNGYLCPAEPETFADQIAQYLALPPEERRQMSEAARATVLAWSWQDAARRFAAVLQRLL